MVLNIELLTCEIHNSRPDPTRNVLVLMAKAPVKGMVKTRLVPWIGEDGAFYLYQCMLEDRLKELSKLKGIDIYIACYPFSKKDTLLRLVPESLYERVKFIPQKGKDLGARILSVVKKFDLSKVNLVFIDADTPSLTSSIVTTSFEELKKYDLVIGPSNDGGYYLIGLKNTYDELFLKMPWGSNKVFSMTVRRAEERNLSVKVLPELIDIDTREDAVLFYSSSGGESITKTGQFLERIFRNKDSET